MESRRTSKVHSRSEYVVRFRKLSFLCPSLQRYNNAKPNGYRSKCSVDPQIPVRRANASQAGTFTVANLYYNHPILNILADDFHVTNERASLVPTVMQGGYAAGILLLCPLGDIFRRRAYVLILVWFTATLVTQEPAPSCSRLLKLNSG